MTSPGKFIDESDFKAILCEVGRCFTHIPRTVTPGGDDYGQPQFDDGTPVEYMGIVQDIETRDIQNEPGLLQVGDKWLFTTNNVSILDTDEVEIDGSRYRMVEHTYETIDRSAAIYKSYVLRRILT